MIRRTVRKAFTLVEILIVVVILGILAAIVVPQFTNATQDAQAGNLKAQLSSLNRQIELYRARTNGSVPAVGTIWSDLITGGYIKNAPVNPAFPGGGTAASDVATATDGTGSATAGWTLTSADSGTIGAADYIPANTLLASYFDEVTGLITPGTP
jgi:prepilin-type N-terminal cleavage/methylation domain-containing protein